MVESYVKVIGDTSGAKAENVEWFSADLATEATSEQFSASKFRIHLAINSAVKVAITLDSGTKWVYLNQGTALTADSAYVFDIPVRKTDTFNMRTDDSAGTTCHYVRISEVSMEG